MNALKTIVIILITLIVVAITMFFLIGFLKPKPGGLQVYAVNPTDVSINGIFVGKTPYTGLHEPGLIILKVGAFETKLNIVSGIQTIVKPGEILTFEKIEGNDAPIKVFSSPKDAQVLIDGTPRGFTPYETGSLITAQHIITVRAPGFIDRTEMVKNITGYRLLMSVQLEKAVVTEKVEPPKVFVEVLKTPNDFLRIREKADTTSKELGRAKTGELLLVLDDTTDGWYKVQKDDFEGYVSAEFVKIANQIPLTETPE